MEERKKSENDKLRRGPLARLHEKIQNKYHAMQRRLDKSRSVDCIDTLDHEFSYKESTYSLNSDLSYSTISDNGDFNEVFESGKRYEKHDIIIEHVKERMAVEEVFNDEASIFEAQIGNYDYLSPLPFFDSDFKASCES